MLDERDGLRAADAESGVAGSAPGLVSAVIIPFPRRASPRTAAQPVDNRHVGLALDAVTLGMSSRTVLHAPTFLSAIGGLTGFAIQQMLLREGGVAWSQPRRAEHLDRILLSERPVDGSLWSKLQEASRAVGAHHLPDPNTLLQATLRCVGTTQFGLITLPLEYKLVQQPQASVTELWTSVTRTIADEGVSNAVLPQVLIAACAQRVAADMRLVPPHVGVRIVMQSALAMALIEPRVIPGAVLKSQAN